MTAIARKIFTTRSQHVLSQPSKATHTHLERGNPLFWKKNCQQKTDVEFKWKAAFQRRAEATLARYLSRQKGSNSDSVSPAGLRATLKGDVHKHTHTHVQVVNKKWKKVGNFCSGPLRCFSPQLFFQAQVSINDSIAIIHLFVDVWA